MSETETRFLAPTLREEEDDFDRSLRPRKLDEFVGQERIKEQLEVALTATSSRGEALDHVLLVGPPGLGKTSLAYIVREELGVGIRTMAGPAVERRGANSAFPRADPFRRRAARVFRTRGARRALLAPADRAK